MAVAPGLKPPAQDLIRIDSERLGEAIPGEAARLLAPSEAFEEVLGQ